VFYLFCVCRVGFEKLLQMASVACGRRGKYMSLINVLQNIINGWFGPVPAPVVVNPITPPAPPPNPPVNSGTIEQEVTNAINVYRVKNGLGQLVNNPSLNNSAQSWSNSMDASGTLEHGNFGPRLSSFGIQFGYAGECIGEGQQTPQQIVDAWYNDPPHKVVLLGVQYKLVGVGVANLYWTCDFTDKV
jgi:uncharacterized protein YkwD